MRNIKPEVYAALKRALPSGKVHPVAPKAAATLPCLSFLELNNIPAAGADDGGYLASVEYAVDIWGEANPEEITAIAQGVDREMNAIGGRRIHCTDVPPDALNTYHKNMIYEFLIGEDE